MNEKIMTTWKNTFILVALLMCSFLYSTLSTEVHKIGIKEKGTLFYETVKIDQKAKTVIFKVPAHNEITRSTMLVDYKTGYLATRIPKLKECHIKRIPKHLFPPILLEKKNIREFEKFKRSHFNLPVKIIGALRVKQRKISRKELSASFLKFCGAYEAYEVKEIYHNKSFVAKGKIQKRVITKDWSKSIIAQKVGVWVTDGKDKWRKVTLNTCKPLNSYFSKLIADGCDEKPDTWEYSCKAESTTCIYNFRCKLDNGKIRCLESHYYTGFVCCDVSCPGKSGK